MPNTRKAVFSGSVQMAATAALQPTACWIVEAVRIMVGPEMKNPGWMAGVSSCAMVENLPLKVRECHSRISFDHSFVASRMAVIAEAGATEVVPMDDAPPKLV